MGSGFQEPPQTRLFLFPDARREREIEGNMSAAAAAVCNRELFLLVLLLCQMQLVAEPDH